MGKRGPKPQGRIKTLVSLDPFDKKLLHRLALIDHLLGQKDGAHRTARAKPDASAIVRFALDALLFVFQSREIVSALARVPKKASSETRDPRTAWLPAHYMLTLVSWLALDLDPELERLGEQVAAAMREAGMVAPPAVELSPKREAALKRAIRDAHHRAPSMTREDAAKFDAVIEQMAEDEWNELLGKDSAKGRGASRARHKERGPGRRTP